MAKKTYHPYLRPTLRNYANSNFLKESKTILNFLRTSALKKVRINEDKNWIYIHEQKIRKSKVVAWMPKLYICVQPQYFWSVISDLISLSKQEKFTWKFAKDLNFFSRPDKIVVYAHNEKDLRRILSKVRPLLKDKKFHKLEFAKSIEKGIYIGADPTFLKKSSWRLYRWTLEECLIKPNLKNGRLDKDTSDALGALNVCLKHWGPKSLTPDKKNIKFIKAVWKQINEK